MQSLARLTVCDLLCDMEAVDGLAGAEPFQSLPSREPDV